jgi:hypothetical protein
LALLAELLPTGFPYVACWAFYPGGALLYFVMREQRASDRVLRWERLGIAAVAFGLLGWRTVSASETPIHITGIYIVPLSLICAWALAWAGWTFASRPITPASQLTRFQIGAVMVVGVAFVASIQRVDLSAGALLIVSFFLLSFAALAITRSAQNAEGRPTWTALSVGAGALVVAVGLLIVAVTNPSAIQTVLGPIFRFFRWLFGLLPDVEPGQPPPRQQGPPPQGLEQAAEIANWIILAFSIAVGVAVLGGMLFVLFLQLRYWLKHPPTRGVKTESIRPEMSPCKAWAVYLVALLVRWRNALERRLLAGRMAHDAHGLYRQLQRWGRRQGLPRATNQTPMEYLDLLGNRWPAGRGDFLNITQAYVVAHYSGGQPSTDTVQASSQSWRAVKRLERAWPIRTVQRLKNTLKGSSNDQR